MEQKPLVQVVCLTYNHEQYIKTCLDGFIMQKTTFPFQVIIHDDASTDGTSTIINDYVEKYPELFHAIIQKENQYSKGISIWRKYIFPVLDAKYTAWCEGDDCWISRDKLQIQFDYMEQHPDVSICTHNALTVNIKTKQRGTFTTETGEKDYTIDEVIMGGGSLFSTNSCFLRTKFFITMPRCFECPGIIDYQIVFYATTNGKCHYYPLVLSQYNIATEGSWTENVWSNESKKIVHYVKLIKMLRKVNRYYHFKYSATIAKKIKEIEFEIINHYHRSIKLTSIQKIHLSKYILWHYGIIYFGRIDCLIKQYIPVLVKLKHRVNRLFGLPGEK